MQVGSAFLAFLWVPYFTLHHVFKVHSCGSLCQTYVLPACALHPIHALWMDSQWTPRLFLILLWIMLLWTWVSETLLLDIYSEVEFPNHTIHWEIAILFYTVTALFYNRTIIRDMYLSYLYVSVFWQHICSWTMCLSGARGGQKWCQRPWNWSKRQVWTMLQALGTEPVARATDPHTVL